MNTRGGYAILQVASSVFFLKNWSGMIKSNICHYWRGTILECDSCKQIALQSVWTELFPQLANKSVGRDWPTAENTLKLSIICLPFSLIFTKSLAEKRHSEIRKTGYISTIYKKGKIYYQEITYQ